MFLTSASFSFLCCMQGRDRKRDQENPDMVLSGKNALVEAIRQGREMEKIFVQDKLRGETEKEIRHLSKEYNIPLVKVPIEKLNQMAGHSRHQGVVALISPIHFQHLEDIIPHLFQDGKNPFFMVLEGVSDVRNLAAISRTAHVMGVDALVITARNTARINDETVRVSAGALLKIPVCREKNMFEVIRILKENGVILLATDLKGAVAAQTCDCSRPLAIIMGDEHHGVTPETLKEADERIFIPQAANFDSLNVSVAAGILMYEVHRQRLLHSK